MYRVRYYGEMYHPDNFNRGVLGAAIRGLNWARWKLETLNQRLVLKYMLREQPFDEAKKKTLVKKFFLDVEQEKLDKEVTSPKLGPELPPEVHMRAERYQRRGHAKATDQAVQEEQHGGQAAPLMRPIPIDGLASRMMAQGRARRYTRDRAHPLVIETDFEAVAPERIGGEEYGRPDRSSSEPDAQEAHSSSARFTPYSGWRPPG